MSREDLTRLYGRMPITSACELTLKLQNLNPLGEIPFLALQPRNDLRSCSSRVRLGYWVLVAPVTRLLKSYEAYFPRLEGYRELILDERVPLSSGSDNFEHFPETT